MLSFAPAQARNVEAVRHWLDGSRCIARDETAYLTHTGDLISLIPEADNGKQRLEDWVEDKLIRFYPGFRDV